MYLCLGVNAVSNDKTAVFKLTHHWQPASLALNRAALYRGGPSVPGSRGFNVETLNPLSNAAPV